MTANSQPDEARELLAAAKRDQHALVILSRDAHLVGYAGCGSSRLTVLFEIHESVRVWTT